MNLLYSLLFFNIFDYSLGIIFHLNDTEHAEMPQLFGLADFDACLIESHTYCLATFDLYGEENSEIYTLIREYSKYNLKHFNYTRVSRGICVETTCQTYIENNRLDINQDLETILEGCFNQTMKEGYNLSSRLQSRSCDGVSQERLSIDTTDIIMGVVLLILCALAVVGSYYDLRRRKYNKENLSKGSQFFQCFSIFKNVQHLFEEEKGDERLMELKGIHGIRVLVECIVVYSHGYFLFANYISNPHEFEKTYENTWATSVYTYSSIVQFFFFISGFLMTYVMLIKEEKFKISWNHLPKILFLRWWRLTPPFAVVLGIMATLFRHVGSGPIWKTHVVNGVASQCRAYYWTHIFYFNNFMIDDIMCSIESWHIATDMQLFILGSIVYLFIHNKSSKIKAATLSFFILLGMVSPVLHVWRLDLDGLLLIKPEFFRTLYDETFRKYHILFYNNLTCFFMGMGNGYLIYYLKKQKIEFPDFMLGKVLCWLIIPAVYGFYYYSSSTFNDVEKVSLTWRLMYASLHRFVIGIISSVWILGLTLKFHGNSFAFWEWKGWLVPSKLSYSLYLIHDNIMHYQIATRTKLMNVDITDSFYIFFKLLFYSQILGIFLYLLVEAPANEIIKIFMGGKREKKKD